MVEGELRELALSYAGELIAAGAMPRPTGAMAANLEGIDAAWFARRRAAAAKAARGAAAPQPTAIAATTDSARVREALNFVRRSFPPAFFFTRAPRVAKTAAYFAGITTSFVCAW